ncbi:MAG: DUF308 domain-containing protein [Lachnospiraceae bacterium]|nr:DUF308 domain-containing protein [Lachnospiraceae bacterium]
MSVISLILGILLIVGGVACFATPLATLFSTGIFIGALFLVYGITGIIKALQKQASGLEILISVLALVIGVISFIRPGSTLVFDGIILYCIAAWFLIQGIVSIVISVQTRETNNTWILGVIVGILGIFLGGYSFLHPRFTAVTAGFLIGFFCIEAGVNLIALAMLSRE